MRKIKRKGKLIGLLRIRQKPSSGDCCGFWGGGGGGVGREGPGPGPRRSHPRHSGGPPPRRCPHTGMEPHPHPFDVRTPPRPSHILSPLRRTPHEESQNVLRVEEGGTRTMKTGRGFGKHGNAQGAAASAKHKRNRGSRFLGPLWSQRPPEEERRICDGSTEGGGVWILFLWGGL